MKTAAILVTLVTLATGCRSSYPITITIDARDTSTAAEAHQGKAVPVANGNSAAVGPAAESGSPVVNFNDLLRGN
jgi:hypothetical protein